MYVHGRQLEKVMTATISIGALQLLCVPLSDLRFYLNPIVKSVVDKLSDFVLFQYYEVNCCCSVLILKTYKTGHVHTYEYVYRILTFISECWCRL